MVAGQECGVAVIGLAVQFWSIGIGAEVGYAAQYGVGHFGKGWVEPFYILYAPVHGSVGGNFIQTDDLVCGHGQGQEHGGWQGAGVRAGKRPRSQSSLILSRRVP